MERLEIASGDFLKNAGLTGLKYLLDDSEARQNRDYGITEDGQKLWISPDFALQADWTDLYFKGFVKAYGPSTVYQGVLDKIGSCLDKIETEKWETGKQEKDDLKYINEKLLSNSYQSGFGNIKEKIERPEVYIQLEQKKLNVSIASDELKERLLGLKEFLIQPLCRETFCMKSIIYNYINRFWDGKCFLLRANAKKDMKELYEKEFVVPLKIYWKSTHEKAKEPCIECGNPMGTKEKTSIAFMKEMGDDLNRKKSTFWNCKVDAFLCPECTFIYSLVPLGFQLIGNKFFFVNVNYSIEALFDANSKRSKAQIESQKEDKKYTSWIAGAMTTLLKAKVKELSNIQVILRGTNATDRYLFSVIQKSALNVLKEEKVQRYLEKLSLRPIVKSGPDFYNVYEKVVMNIIQYHNQYDLLNRLFKWSVETEAINYQIWFVYLIQVWSSIIKKEGRRNLMNRFEMNNSGYALRKALLSSKGAVSDESMRGTVYQLINALSVRNDKKFTEIVMRVYCSSKLEMPYGFVEMLGDTEKFLEYGYAFVLGLKGSNRENFSKKTESTEGEDKEAKRA